MSLIAASFTVDRPDDVGAALDDAAAASSSGARLVEWRVDALASESRAAVLRLVAESPLPCIVTCRERSEGGAWDGPDAERLELWRDLLAAGAPPRYLDVELAAWRRSTVLADTLRGMLAAQSSDRRTGLILSAHDFEGRPADLLQSLEAMLDEPACSVTKLAWRARSLRDNLEAFDLLASRRKPAIVLCMGSFGLMSRVLAPKFGGLLTFATGRAGEETAPGQPAIDELRGLYGFDSIGGRTAVYGVIGWPVAHSRSPAVHNTGFSAVGHDGVYLPMPVGPDWLHFKATIGALLDHRGLGFRGASVTIPHKAHLLRFVREAGGAVDPRAELCGAANTLVVGDDGTLTCSNTDAPAAVAALAAGMGVEPAGLRGRRAIVLGAGGVARAVVAGLCGAGVDVSVVNRTHERAEELVTELRGWLGDGAGELSVIDGAALSRCDLDIIVNCTSIGMSGDPMAHLSPLDVLAGGAVALSEHVIVFDTVYAPRRTPLLEQAEAAGARTVEGMAMFTRQAAMQFEMWTGAKAPEAVFS